MDVYRTAASAGVISSREFVELHLLRPKDGGFILTSMSVTSQQLANAPVVRSNPVRAFTYPGCGMFCRPSTQVRAGSEQHGTEALWDVEIVGNVDVGGWVPVKAINAVITTAMGH